MSKPRVLIVDDQELFRDAMESELQFLGFDTTVAEDGLMALEICKTNNFDLIVSDMRMPRCDGKQFLIEFRKIHKTAPPFVIMTGFTDMRVSEAFALGADAFLGKPLNPDRLEQIVKKFQKPIDTKWTGKYEASGIPSIQKKFQSWDDVERFHQLSLGRIGFSATQMQELDLLTMKSKVTFDFEFAEGPFSSLAGFGEVVWINVSEDASHRAVVGIEIEVLDSRCRDLVIQYLQQKKTVESIPTL